MHTDYRDAKVKELRDQLTRFSPRDEKVAAADRTEKLLGEIESDRQYAIDYVTFRVTGYRGEKPTRHNVASEDVKSDLRLLIEDLSESADLRAEDLTQPVHTVAELARTFGVSTKTISRWREDGLVARRITFGSRRRVGFLQSSVDAFTATHKDKVSRGRNFSQLSGDEKGEIIERARTLAQGGWGLSDVTRMLAEQMGRSPETIRYTLKNFDEQNDLVAIFPKVGGSLSGEDRRMLYRMHCRGMSIPQLAKRFRRSITSVHRILADMRAETVTQLPLDYIYNEDFEDASRYDEFTASMPEAETAPRKTRKPSDLPSYLSALYDVPLLTREQEQHLFRKMNYYKHLASRLRDQLETQSSGRNKLMDRIEEYYEAAVRVKNRIVQCNLRLVVSIAKRHMNATDDFFILVSDGNMSLIKAVEKFDYARGNKFSTYASWAIMKNFARSIPREFKHRDRFRTTTEELFMSHQDERRNPYLEETVQKTRQRELSKIMNRLDSREYKIIQARYGLGSDDKPQTLKEVGETLGVTKERIRQLEARALVKLREAADEAKIDLELGA